MSVVVESELDESISGPAKARRKPIPDRSKCIVWGRAAGRCQYAGCNASLIGDEISITVVRVAQGGVRLGIVAPSGLTVMREELCLPGASSLGDGAHLPDRPAKIHS